MLFPQTGCAVVDKPIVRCPGAAPARFERGRRHCPGPDYGEVRARVDKAPDPIPRPIGSRVRNRDDPWL